MSVPAHLAALEGTTGCIATASGMAAILITILSLLKAGDHVVCSSGVFGSTIKLFQDFVQNPDDVDGIAQKMEDAAAAAFG